MRMDEMTRQSITSSDILQLVNSGILEDPVTRLETCAHQQDLAQATTVLCQSTRNAMDQLPVMSAVHVFETENSIIHYTSSVGLSLYIVPRLVNHNGSEQEIRPAFVSDGLTEMLDEDLYLYICDSFSPEEQLEILQEIMHWYQANLLSSRNNVNRRICQCVSDLCRELQRPLNSDICD